MGRKQTLTGFRFEWKAAIAERVQAANAKEVLPPPD
jgi:hypothetical protein